MKLRKGFLSLIAAASMALTSVAGGLFVVPAGTAMAAPLVDIVIKHSTPGYSKQNDVSLYPARDVAAWADAPAARVNGGYAGFGTTGQMVLTGTFPTTLPNGIERPAGVPTTAKLSLRWKIAAADTGKIQIIDNGGHVDEDDTAYGSSVKINWGDTAVVTSAYVVYVDWGYLWDNEQFAPIVKNGVDGAGQHWDQVSLYKPNILTNPIRVLDPRLNPAYAGSVDDYNKVALEYYDIDSHDNDAAPASKIVLYAMYESQAGSYETLDENSFVEIVAGKPFTKLAWTSDKDTIAVTQLDAAGGFVDPITGVATVAAAKGSHTLVRGHGNGEALITAAVTYTLDGGQSWQTGSKDDYKIVVDAYVSEIKAKVTWNGGGSSEEVGPADNTAAADTNGALAEISTTDPIDLSEYAKESTIQLSAKTTSTFQTLPEGTKYHWYVKGKYADRIRLDVSSDTSKATVTALAPISNAAADKVFVYAYAENEKNFDDRGFSDQKFIDQWNLLDAANANKVFAIGVTYSANDILPLVYVPYGGKGVLAGNTSNKISVKFGSVDPADFNKFVQQYTDVANDGEVGYEIVPAEGSGIKKVSIYGADDNGVPADIAVEGTGKVKIRAHYQDAGIKSVTDWLEVNFTPNKEVEVKTETVKVDVSTPVITFGNGNYDTSVGSAKAVTATTQNLNGATVTYSSSDPSIATVDPKTGVVTGKSAGTVTITATATVDGKEYKASKVITIKPVAADNKEVTGQPKVNDPVTFANANYKIESINGTTGTVTLTKAPNGSGKYEVPANVTYTATLSDGSKVTYTLAVTTIEKQAFAGTKYSVIKFPASVAIIRNGAMRSMSNLKKVVFQGTPAIRYVGKNVVKNTKSGLKVKGIKGSDYEDVRTSFTKSNKTVVFK